MARTSMSIRVTDDAKALMEQLAQDLGISKTAVIEIAVRRLAEAERTKEEVGK